MSEKCECCGRPKDDKEALDEILHTIRADNAEAQQRLRALIAKLEDEDATSP